MGVTHQSISILCDDTHLADRANLTKHVIFILFALIGHLSHGEWQEFEILSMSTQLSNFEINQYGLSLELICIRVGA